MNKNMDEGENATQETRLETAAHECAKKRFKVYTKTGDDGHASLYNLERRPKADQIFDCLGDCDETNVAVGLARVHAYDYFMDRKMRSLRAGDWLMKAKAVSVKTEAEAEEEEEKCFEDVLENLKEIQSRLLDIGSAIATPITSAKSSKQMLLRCKFDERHCEMLEKWIDSYEDELPALTQFLCPGGTKFAAFLHQARAICRRCERKVQPMVESGDCEKQVQQYLNRLSDYFFVVARIANQRVNVLDVPYKKA